MNTKINKFFNFKNKVVLITGPNGIIGKQLCNFYLDQEAFVFGIDTKKKLIKIKNYQHFQGDATNENFLLKKINFIVKKKSKIDIILNCAGIQFFTHFEKRTKKEIYKTLDANLIGVHNMIKSYVKIHSKKNLKSCHIINFGSIYGMRSPDFRIYAKKDRFSSEIYGASKASIIQMTKYLAVMYVKKKIFINCISPGGTVIDKSNVSKNFYRKYSKRVPIGRMATPKDLLTAIIYLSNQETKYTVGQNIVVDGGLTAW